jgi:hypothetical protein
MKDKINNKFYSICFRDEMLKNGFFENEININKLFYEELLETNENYFDDEYFSMRKYIGNELTMKPFKIKRRK